jgi:hypothetical protein
MLPIQPQPQHPCTKTHQRRIVVELEIPLDH